MIRYHSGGAGYVLSKEAFERLGSKLNQNYTYCQNSGVEDVDIAGCLRNLGVYPNSSVDNFGLERFHPMSMDRTFKGSGTEWLINYSKNPPQKVIFLISTKNLEKNIK